MRSLSWISQARVLLLMFLFAAIFVLVFPVDVRADVEGSLLNIRTQLTETILPLLSVIGLGLASMSFYTGNPQAKQHVIYAILGCAFGFGAQQIVDLIARLVH